MSTGDSAEDLMALGALAASLSPDDLGRSLDVAAELLRTVAHADDREIFLYEPEGGDLVLTACCGSDREAFMERVRFQPGVGYPGLVAATGEPLLTRHLDRDRRRGDPSDSRCSVRSPGDVDVVGLQAACANEA